jgi:hypothetical protein
MDLQDLEKICLTEKQIELLGIEFTTQIKTDQPHLKQFTELYQEPLIGITETTENGCLEPMYLFGSGGYTIYGVLASLE